MKTMTSKCLGIAVAALTVNPVVAAPAEEAIKHPHGHDHAHANTGAVFMTEKLTAPIGIGYEFADQPVAGVPLTIHLSIGVASTHEHAQLRLVADDGLLLLDAPASQVLGALGPESGARMSVTVLPERSSRLRVSVTVGNGSASSLFRSVSIPVRLPDGAAAEKTSSRSGQKSARLDVRSGVKSGDAVEDAVHPFQARETIR